MRKGNFSNRVPEGQNFAALATYQKIAQEMRAEHDLHSDDVTDIILRFRAKQMNNLAEVSLYEHENLQCFRAILTNDRMIGVLEKYLKDKERGPFKRLLLDATGKITAPVNNKAMLHHVLLAPYPKVDSPECYLVPVAEMITDDSRGQNIGYFLNFVLSQLSPATFKLLRQIGTDDSWANVNGIFMLTPGMSVTQYLRMAYDVYKGEAASETLLKIITPSYCYSHFCKNWQNDLNQSYDEPHVRSVLRTAMSKMTTMADSHDLHVCITAFLILTSSEHENKQTVLARQLIGKVDRKLKDDQDGDDFYDVDNPLHKAMYADSPFYQQYNKFLQEKAPEEEEEEEEEQSRKPNKYFAPAFVEKFIKHYIAFLPFWTVFIAKLQNPLAERSNNARVEGYFRILKDECAQELRSLTRLGNIRIGRYAKFREGCLTALCNEVEADLPTKQVSQTHRPHKLATHGINKSKASKKQKDKQAKCTRPQPRKSSIEEETFPHESSLSQMKEEWAKSRRKTATDVAPSSQK